MRNWKRLLKMGLVGLMVVIGSLSLWVPAQAASSAPQTPTSSPVSIMGINLAGGFTQEPLDSNQVSGHTVTLAAKGTRNILEAATNPFGSRKYVWWESTDGGNTYSTVGSNSTTYTFTAPNVTQPTELLFQAEYDFTGIGLFYNEWSRIAAVEVEPSRVPATAIKVTADKTYLNNSDTTLVHADLTPSNSTDQVTWTSSDPSLATVDEYGDVTATDVSSKTDGTAHDHGTVTITGKANGHSDDVKITIGALQDVNTVEGKAATFSLKDLPDGVTVNNWYRVQDGESTALNSTDTSYTINKPTQAGDDGTSYYAVLNYTVSGSTKTITTNSAKLNVEKSGLISLTAVPDFNFGDVDLLDLSQGLTLDNLDAIADGQAYDGNSNGSLSVMDSRDTGGSWTLTAALQPFGFVGSNGGQLGSTSLDLYDPNNRLDITIPDNDQATSIYTSSDYDGQDWDVSNSQLDMGASPLASAGSYESTVTWTLTVAPS
ncbi:Ig-like domain-containing protein [Levilactobacillus humaensis]|uniref:Ig-like domain-containing protein n=1 Tax=Levilactobacillus humaensis TaxID=2950375 RepID=UPI0021C47B1D|nr:Ig-like domain-containing protein [Levilactobacillus humaensis]